MGVFEQFPYTNFHDLNLDWIIEEVKTMRETLDSIEKTILEEAHAYTDEEIGKVYQEIQNLRVEMDSTIQALDRKYDAFKSEVNGNIKLFQLQIDNQNKKIEEDVIAINARTDYAIELNNEKLYDYIGKQVIDVKVRNFFTGEMVTNQQMFDYLASLHVSDPALYDSFPVEINKTYNQLAALNINYTDIAISGKHAFN